MLWSPLKTYINVPARALPEARRKHVPAISVRPRRKAAAAARKRTIVFIFLRSLDRLARTSGGARAATLHDREARERCQPHHQNGRQRRRRGGRGEGDGLGMID